MATITPARTLLAALTIGTVLLLLWPLVARAMQKNEYRTQGVMSSTTAIALIAPPVSQEVSNEVKIRRAFEDAPIMADIAKAESTYCLHQTNPTSSAKGCFQILDGTWKGAGCTGDPFNTEDNIACARKLYETSGTNPWLASSANW